VTHSVMSATVSGTPRSSQPNGATTTSK
jgi:hypothetical protein